MGFTVSANNMLCPLILTAIYSAQTRTPIQVLDDAKDAVQTLHVTPTSIMTGSVDGHVRVYDLRKGQLRSDYIGRTLGETIDCAPH